MEPVDSDVRPLVTTRELVEWLRVSRRTLCRLRRKGDFPAPVSVGANLRWRPEDIECWIVGGGSPKAKVANTPHSRKPVESVSRPS